MTLLVKINSMNLKENSVFCYVLRFALVFKEPKDENKYFCLESMTPWPWPNLKLEFKDSASMFPFLSFSTLIQAVSNMLARSKQSICDIVEVLTLHVVIPIVKNGNVWAQYSPSNEGHGCWIKAEPWEVFETRTDRFCSWLRINEKSLWVHSGMVRV